MDKEGSGLLYVEAENDPLMSFSCSWTFGSVCGVETSSDGLNKPGKVTKVGLGDVSGIRVSSDDEMIKGVLVVSTSSVEGTLSVVVEYVVSYVLLTGVVGDGGGGGNETLVTFTFGYGARLLNFSDVGYTGLTLM